MRQKVIEISKEHSIVSPETSFIMLEIIEDPVLGMPITHMVPLNISEEVIKDISRTSFLDTPTFVYKTTGVLTKEDILKKGDNVILDARYPRENILRTLAKNQFADGSFADADKDKIYNRIETTAMVLLAFTLGKDDITIYINQLNKSIRFLLKTLEDNKNLLDEKLLIECGAALKASLGKGIAVANLQEQCLSALSNIKQLLVNKEDIANLLINSQKLTLKSIAPFILTMSKDNNAITEKIVLRDEKNSIFSLAKLGILKSV
jgi:Ca-activated chloride channel family protein